MADTSNEELRDALVRHQVGLLRVSGALRNKIVELLNATEGDLLEKLLSGLDKIAAQPLTEARRARLERLLEEVRKIRTDAHGEAFRVWREELLAIADHEVDYMEGVLTLVSPVVLDLVAVQPSYLQTLLDTHPFEGRVLRDWAQRIASADIDRITQQVRIGLVQGETARQIAARVVGTAARQGANGVTEITRRDAASLTRTAVNAFSNEARKAFSEANSDIADMEMYLATLDSRTTPICRSLDGKTYPVGEGPRPPMHWQCRSLRVLLLNGQVLGTRPLKTSTERQLVEEYRQRAGLGTGPKTRAGLPRGHKGEFDAFARRRVRELTGTAPASLSYQDFLKRQSPAFQDDVLGQAKGRLFRQGGLTLDKFVDQAGRERTLADLARTERAAFKAAGLDPDRWA